MEIGIEKVLRRIRAIEQRFAPQGRVDAGAFPQALQTEQNRLAPPQKAAQSAVSAAGHGAIGNGGNSLQALVERTALQYGVDPALANAVAKTESGYDPNATSSVGAAGVMQLMPETARSLGVGNLYDPQENIEGGVKYLKEMLTTFDGDVTKAVAAYNAGPQAVKSYQGVPPYAETQDYVRKVLDIYR